MEDCVCLSHTKKCSWPESQGCVEETLLSLHVSGSQSSVLSLHTWLLLSHGDVNMLYLTCFPGELILISVNRALG